MGESEERKGNSGSEKREIEREGVRKERQAE